jgi:hypothetical protein
MTRFGTWLKRRVLPVRRRGGFARDERGTTAVEFALLGIPFFSIIGAILETSLIFFAGQILDSAVNDSARLIRTGQAQSLLFTPENFRDTICDGLYGLFDCDQVRVNVSVVATFDSVAIPQAVDPDACTPEDCEWTVPEAYAPGGGEDIVLVQAYYRWPTILEFGSLNLENLGDGSRLLASVRVFMNEPFGGG